MTIEKCLIMDNGSYTIKYGWKTDKSPEFIQNWIICSKDRRHQYVGREINHCKEMSNIHVTTPFQVFVWYSQY